MTENKAKETAKERVQKELDDLNGKIVNLTMFMTSPTHAKMNEAEKYLLLKQLDVMVDYACLLKSRLAIWREIDE